MEGRPRNGIIAPRRALIPKVPLTTLTIERRFLPWLAFGCISAACGPAKSPSTTLPPPVESTKPTQAPAPKPDPTCVVSIVTPQPVGDPKDSGDGLMMHEVMVASKSAPAVHSKTGQVVTTEHALRLGASRRSDPVWLFDGDRPPQRVHIARYWASLTDQLVHVQAELSQPKQKPGRSAVMYAMRCPALPEQIRWRPADSIDRKALGKRLLPQPLVAALANCRDKAGTPCALQLESGTALPNSGFVAELLAAPDDLCSRENATQHFGVYYWASATAQPVRLAHDRRLRGAFTDTRGALAFVLTSPSHLRVMWRTASGTFTAGPETHWRISSEEESDLGFCDP